MLRGLRRRNPAPGVRGTTKLGQLERTGGTGKRELAMVEGFVRKRLGAINACYERELRKVSVGKFLPSVVFNEQFDGLDKAFDVRVESRFRHE